jgi:hypothetical protein
LEVVAYLLDGKQADAGKLNSVGQINSTQTTTLDIGTTGYWGMDYIHL